jgi:hypothetical protein
LTLFKTERKTIIIQGAQAERSSGMEEDVVVIPVQSDVYIVSTPSERRLDVSHVGTKTVLALRVTSLDASPSLSASTISSRLFTGVGATISSVYRDCSWNSLNVLPASGAGIVDGVSEIFINQNTVGATAQSFENAVTAAARNQVSNFDDIDHIMYCVSQFFFLYARYRFEKVTSTLLLLRCLVVQLGLGSHIDTWPGIVQCIITNGVSMFLQLFMKLAIT